MRKSYIEVSGFTFFGSNLLKRVIFFVCLTFMVMFLGNYTAHGHAQVNSINIADGAQLGRIPDKLVITYNEIVTGREGSIQLLNSDGKILLRSGKINDDVVSLKLGKLKAGRYVVRWGVTSADGHPIAGAIAFALNLKTPGGLEKKYDLYDSLSGKKNLVLSINGERAGKRYITLTGLKGEGSIELRSKIFGAPFIWNLSGDGETLVGSGILPSSGIYDVTVRIRTGVFDEVVSTGTISIKK